MSDYEDAKARSRSVTLREHLERLRDAIRAARLEALKELPEEGLGPISREHYRRALAEADLTASSCELAIVFLARGD